MLKSPSGIWFVGHFSCLIVLHLCSSSLISTLITVRTFFAIGQIHFLKMLTGEFSLLLWLLPNLEFWGNLCNDLLMFLIVGKG